MWKFLSGYVMIQAEGKNLERFLNLLMSNGLDIKNIRRNGPYSLTLDIVTFDFYRLRSIIRKNKVRIKIRILKKRGLFVHLLVLRFRKALIFGLPVMLALLAIASRSVWFINVEGCDKVSEAEVEKMLYDMGIKRGSLKNSFKLSTLADKIMAEDERIASADANISGVVLNIGIQEATIIEEQGERTGYASIYAQSSGKIKRIVALMGKPCVRAGDIVQEGDLLITGELNHDDKDTMLVCATGEVLANVIHTFTAVEEPLEKTLVRTGNYVDFTKVSILGFELYKEPQDFSLSESESMSSKLFEGGALPMKLVNQRCYELEEKELQVDTLTLTERAIQKADIIMQESLDKNARILSKKTVTQILDDGSVEATIIVTTEQNIAQIREF